jgi:hypothetical protein
MTRSGVIDLHAARRASPGTRGHAIAPGGRIEGLACESNLRIEGVNDDESQVPFETGNRGVTDGSLPHITRNTLKADLGRAFHHRQRPPHHVRRERPPLKCRASPNAVHELSASVDFAPRMTAEDLGGRWPTVT